MLSWIKNLHTCKAETFSWHSEFWLVLGPHPPRNAPGALQSILPALALVLLTSGLCPGVGLLQQHPWLLWHVALTVSVLAVIRIPLEGGGSCAACCRTSGKGRR